MIPKLTKVFQALLVFFLAAIIAYPLIIAAKFGLIYKNKVYPKIKVVDLDLAGKTKSQALDLLKKQINNKNIKFLTLKYKNNTWQIDFNRLNFLYLADKTVNKAYSLGRKKEFQESILSKWQLWQQGANLPLDYQLDDSLFNQQVATIAALVDQPAIPATIEIKTIPAKHVEVIAGKQGKQINQEKLKKQVNDSLSWLKTEEVVLPVENILPQITQNQAEKTKIRAEGLLNKTIKIGFKQDNWLLEDVEIINFLDFETGFDKEKVASYTAQLAKLIDRQPQNALFNFQNSRVVEFKPASQGFKLNQEKTVKFILEALQDLETKDLQTTSFNLPVDISQPEIATSDVNNLGIQQLIGRGESWFRGSIQSRVHNIQLASQKLNGLLIPAGQTFSFNQSLGEVSSQTGFQQAYVIKEGRTVLGDGGGVCQVSTTLFRAVLDAGLAIEERQAHAYRVSYYEQNYQVGVDATVFEPSPDLKFKNDTPAHILIQSYADLYNLKLTFDLYGSWDGRQATISKSRVWDQIPPPPDLYQDYPTLPAGVIKQVDWKAWGAKAAFDWKVIRSNDVLQERTFYSYYKPWQAVFLKGTGQ